MGIVKVGISAWTEPTLLDSGWYPRGARAPTKRLGYYASQFPIAEIDSSYYALPTRHQADVWNERTPRDFTFNVKAYAPLTRHYTDTRRLPRDLAEALPPELRDKARVYPHQLPSDIMSEIVRRFRDALEPLQKHGKLGVVLFQYPVWFTYSIENLKALAGISELLSGLRIAVEFRNRTWLTERTTQRTLDFLKEHGLTLTCVDEPQGFVSSVPRVAAVTAPLALVRMHGRNATNWDAKNPTAAERMAYLYSDRELGDWVPPVRRLAHQADEVHVIMNNCFSDYAVRNASRLSELLITDGEMVARPAA